MTKLTGLVGYPTEHSKSPAIHEYWTAQHHLEIEYKLFTTPPSRIRQVVKRLHDKEAVGFNVTVPHKIAVMEFLDEVDAIATRIGAVNTVTRRGDKLVGTNTDAYGFITNLREGLGDLTPYLKNIVILGAGGATRAVMVALKDAGAEKITLINRSLDKAQALAREFNVAVASWDQRHGLLEGVTLLINTTSLGMDGQPSLDINLSALPKTAAVHDIVYAPLETTLLQNASHRGHRVADGIGMLFYQAQKAFEIWHGILPEVTPALRNKILES